ncbi:MAG: TonB-dependent receptor [Pseudomonadota bacterium]
MRTHASNKTRLLITTALTVGLAAPAAAQEVEGEGFFTALGRIVFGAGAPKVAIDVPQSVTAIEEEDFDRAQPRTLGDVVSAAPGISTVGSESPFGETFNIRGIGTGTSADEPRIITLIDGVKKYYESYRQGSLFTDPAFFKSVEVLRGPGSSTLYGAGAVGGVISTETKDAADFLVGDDTFAVDQTLEYRSNGDGVKSTTFLAFGPNESFEGLLGFIYSDSDFVEDGAGNDALGTAVETTSYLVKGTFTFGEDMDQSLSASYIRYRGFADDQVLDVIDNFTFGPTADIVDRTVIDETAVLEYTYTPLDNDLIDLSLQLGYSDTINEVEDYRGVAGASFNSDYRYRSYSVRADNTAAFSGAAFENFLTFGAEYYDQDRITLRPTPGNATFQPQGNIKVTSLFAQNELILNEQLTLLTGARIDYQDASPGDGVPTTSSPTDSAVAGTVAVHYQQSERVAFFGSASYTERLPVIDELFTSSDPNGDADVPAAGFLDPERSVNVELGASYKIDDVFQGGDQLSFKGTVFRNTIDDVIVRAGATSVAGDRTYLNDGELRFTGIEIEGGYESETVFGSLALTILEGKNVGSPDDANSNLQNRIPEDSLRLTLGRRIPDWNLELGWTGNVYDTDTRSTFSGELTNPTNVVHDVYASWTPDAGALDGAEIRLGISNLFDKEYRRHLQSSNVRRAGRSINLTLSTTF